MKHYKCYMCEKIGHEPEMTRLPGKYMGEWKTALHIQRSTGIDPR